MGLSRQLGDYIHLTVEGYQRHGVAKYSEKISEPYYIYNNFLQNRAKNLKSISPETINELKMRIANDSEIKEKRDYLKLQQNYEKNLTKVYDTISHFTTNELLSNFESSGNSFAYPKGTKNLSGLTKNQIKNQINLLNKIRGKIRNINNRKNKQVSEKEIKQLLKDYNKLITAPELDANLAPVAAIQKALDGYSFDSIYTAISGRFGEELVYSARDAAWGVALDHLNSTMQEEKIVGGDASDIQINKDLFAADVSKIFKFKNQDDNNNVYTINKTQDKVDVQIIVNQEDVYASVKNYKDVSAHNLKLQSDMSLFYALAFLNQYIKNFGTHWINMHALNNKKGYSFNTEQKNADLILKQEMAYEALVSGNPLKQNASEANTFIYIDRTSGKVSVENTIDILKNIDKKLVFSGSSKDLSSIHLANKKANTPEDRVLKILTKLHSMKISVLYNSTFKTI